MLQINSMQRITETINQLTKPEHHAIGLDFSQQLSLKTSAVLVPISMNEQGPEILLTVRPQGLSSHAGQVCFPGGRYEQAVDQDHLATALRESREETGIHPNNILHSKPFGYLDTLSGYRIFPHLALVDQHKESLVFNQDEVAAHFWFPLKATLMKESYERTTRSVRGLEVPTFALNHEGHDIWGATALIMYSMAKYYG